MPLITKIVIGLSQLYKKGFFEEKSNAPALSTSSSKTFKIEFVKSQIQTVPLKRIFLLNSISHLTASQAIYDKS